MSEGVSIVVCCYNSARVLPDTLRHLHAQKLSPGRSCEVIIVDNASTDGTPAVAQEFWPSECLIKLRVVLEPKLGLSNARRRGFAEAQYETICFVDDDNRLDSNWVEIASDIMCQHPEVGACGGRIEADSENPRPSWFERFQNYYAVGTQSERAGDITDARGYLWGAGLCLRRRAWKQVLETGFEFLLSDRKGAGLSAGGDAEMCYALRLHGWRLWYEPRLQMSHYIAPERLKWSYVRQVSRGFGAATAGLDAYELAINSGSGGTARNLRRSWGWQILATVKALLSKPIALLRAPLSPMEGDPDVLQIETLWGRLGELLKHRRSYLTGLRDISAINPGGQPAKCR